MPKLLDIRLRAGSSSAWTLTNPVLGPAEPGFELDTGKLKVGDGATVWTALNYVGGLPEMLETIDAAELSTLLRAPFTVTASGNNTIVTPPAGRAIRLRRLMPVMSDPDGASNPLLTLRLGTDEVARGYVLSGRFDITGSVDAPLILNLSKAGSVSGTVFYEAA